MNDEATMYDGYDEWEEPAGAGAPAGRADAEPVLALAFPNVYAFVDGWLLPRYRRNPANTRWDPRWFENLEALDRIEALWRSFEYMRHQGMTGMQVFWNDYLSPTMRELTAPDGVFWYTAHYGDEKRVPPLLNSDPAPAEVAV